MAKKTKSQPTQEYLPFSEIRDGIVIMKDGSLRLILLTSATNFALKSEEEQNAVIFGYQSFINSLSFPVQILMQSRRLDLTNYLKQLKEAQAKQSNELLRIQIQDYSRFVEQLISVANIMDKKFFVVVPFFPGATGGKKGVPRGRAKTKVSDTDFQSSKQELTQRANVVAQGLGTLGIRVVQLETQEVIGLLYATYNKDLAPTEPLAEARLLTAPVIEREPVAAAPPAG